eukprot:TRINITY_DN7235_c0_g1_i1.p1 TRINITY_DN7235_c0_g1~~TRINITY_DN7235_c0_g1_i1.p1  ORF type:complete len:236 (+),score=49.19 TRINITY_DN7235_c0_g1_i1:62-769(+)
MPVSLTLGIMKAAVGAGCGAGLLSGAVEYLRLQIMCSDSSKEEEEEKEGEEEELRQLRRFVREDERDMHVMRIMLRAMAGAGVLTIVGSIPFCVHNMHLPLRVAAGHAGKAMLLFLPVGTVLAAGSGSVAANLPSFFMALTITSSALTVAGLPVQYMIGASKASVTAYITGLRIGVSGASSLLITMFCNRYARLQGRKKLAQLRLAAVRQHRQHLHSPIRRTRSRWSLVLQCVLT